MNSRFAIGGLLAVAAAFAVAIAPGQSPQAPAPSSQPRTATPQSSPAATSPQPAQSNQAPSILQTNTRLVTVDVIATNSHGPVRDLKIDDFELTDNGRQKIEKFAFIDKSSTTATNSANTAQPKVKGFYSNQTTIQHLDVPATVVLMDSLNTDIANLVQTRHHMLAMLKTLPSNTPVAVFLLGNSLRVVQGFTSDPALLRAAVDKTMSPSSEQQPMPEDDPDAASLMAFDDNGGQEDAVSQQLEDFEKNSYANQMDIRVDTTLDALKAIAHYLSGYQGRKNLIWVSESFPIVLWPDPDFGSTTAMFQSSRAYGDQLQDVANALSDAQVAVYPVDARGLDGSQIFSAAQNTPTRRGSPARSLSAQLRREDNARTNAQQTMEALADESGGKTCKNTNDLSGCIESALNDGSSYYELAYYPQDAKWDGSFHKISLKTTRSGVKLTYRRGYFAQDPQAIAAKQPPEKRLQQACQDFLPSTQIPVMVQGVPPQKPDELRYVVAVDPKGLSFAPAGDQFKLNAMMANCIYDHSETTFHFLPRDLSQTLTPAAYQTVQRYGLRGYVDFPDSGADRIRIAVLDVNTGLIGSLDVPVRKNDYEVATPVAPPKNTPPSPVSTSVRFNLSSGQSSALDWGGDKVVYTGNLDVKQAAPAFFSQYYFHQGFSCSEGALKPNDPKSTEAPRMQLTFTNAAGQTAIIDLK
ncbi:MAG TPA: VWA domain-containing protein, partial [Candidatus Acidoferrales bacterium]